MKKLFNVASTLTFLITKPIVITNNLKLLKVLLQIVERKLKMQLFADSVQSIYRKHS